MWTLIAAPGTGAGIERPALNNIGAICRCRLSWIHTRASIPPVRPCSERERSYRRNPKVVTGKRNSPIVKLLEVRIALDGIDGRLAHRPVVTIVERFGSENIERTIRVFPESRGYGGGRLREKVRSAALQNEHSCKTASLYGVPRG